ncbi:hypothetical protein GOM96_03995 [Stutzerimonas degradans]|jgi:hypothetical protein|nr:hypothetical protein GOM96_03995 [Stutzerimonas degradans]
MNLKEKLKEIFKESHSAPFLFIGSGFSRRYLNLENWEDLLKKFTEQIGENYSRIRTQANGDLPTTASILAEKYAQAWWDHSCKGSKDEEYAADLTKADSPLKIEIADYLRNIPALTQPALPEEISLLRDSKIDGIITTNWDNFLETIFPDFATYIGQDDIITSRSHGIAEIYKIHGCASKPNSLILTSADYEGYRKRNPYLSSKLTTLFIEHPIFFLGYSLTDPHILEIMEEIVSCFPSDKLEMLRRNIYFVLWDPERTEPSLTETVFLKRLPLTLIQTNSYLDIFAALSETKRRLPAKIFRQIKDELYELVLTDDPKGQLYVKSADSFDENANPKDFVVAYGAISDIKKAEQVSKRGLIGLDRFDIVRDVVFENSNYDPEGVISETLPKILRGAVYTPIFKYIKEAKLINEDGSIDDKNFCEILKEKIAITPQSLRTQGFEERRAANTPEVKQGIEALYNNYDFNLFLRMAPFIEPDIIDIAELQKILKTHIDQDLNPGHRSQLIKIVCLYDMLKNNPARYLKK